MREQDLRDLLDLLESSQYFRMSQIRMLSQYIQFFQLDGNRYVISKLNGFAEESERAILELATYLAGDNFYPSSPQEHDLYRLISFYDAQWSRHMTDPDEINSLREDYLAQLLALVDSARKKYRDYRSYVRDHLLY